MASSGAASTGEDAAMQQRHQLLFGASERFQISGKVVNVNPSRGEIMIARDNLPPALLKVEPQTKLEHDGQQATLDQLKPGEDVRASFNLSGRRPIALEVNASANGSTTPGSMGSSTSPGSSSMGSSPSSSSPSSGSPSSTGSPSSDTSSTTPPPR